MNDDADRGRVSRMTDRLTICYNAWMAFSEDDHYDEQIRQIAERGFNCVRIEDGAGLIWDEQGNVREILVSVPFGKYTQYTAYRIIADNKRINVLERLLRICRAAQKYGVKVVLSSWFFLHTNWFCEEKDKQRLFAMSTEEKMSFFADELGRILTVLRNEGLIDVVAFAEIFNEFDGLPFAGEYRGLSADEANRLRILHENEIDKLRQQHPDVLFAFDTYTAKVQDELIPRNIDVLNFHCYYLWPIYSEFEKGIICWSLEEPEIPEETRYFLKEKPVTVKEVAEAMDNLRTGLDWPRRISLYVSIDTDKEDELTAFLDGKLGEQLEHYRKKFRDDVERIFATRARTVPNSRIVMGEGATYCASPTLAFERDSRNFWMLLKEQMEYFRETDVWGTVITTTHAPGRSAAWGPCKELYAELNAEFLKK